MSQIKKLLVALTPMGAAAYVAGGGTFGSIGELVRWAERPSFHRPAASESTKGDPLWRTKKALLLMMAVGAAAYFGFSGTFANFQAETANNGSTISSGTLTLNNQVNSAAACFSYTSVTADNINSGCDAAFAATNTAPGLFQSTQVAKLTLTNSGSLDASKLYLYASQVNGKLATGLTAGQTGITSLALTASNPAGLEGSVAIGNSIVLSYGGHTQTFTATAAAAGGATSISVSSATAAFDFPAGSNLANTSGNTTASNTDCYDTKTTVGGSVGSTFGTQLNFNPTTSNPFCGAVLMWIQEVSGANTYCWFGKGSTFSSGSSFTQDANGRCVAPISVTTSGISGTISSIPLTGGTTLNGNVAIGDQILVTQGTHTQTFTAATTSETYGAASIAVTPGSVVGSPFTAGATVTNVSAQSSLNSAAGTDNVTAFQTAHHLSAGKIELFPMNGNASIDNTSGTTELNKGAGAARTFYVGLYLPVPAGSNQNPLQGLASTFGLTWHIDQ
jgi:hypothetical protein